LPRYDWLAGLVDTNILDEGPSRKEWIDGPKAWLEAIMNDPQFSDLQKREAQERQAHYTAPALLPPWLRHQMSISGRILSCRAPAPSPKRPPRKGKVTLMNSLSVEI
jgi:hypothetical protein